MGTVVAINADDGMRVQAGQVLVQLDPNDAKVALEQAQANLAAVSYTHLDVYKRQCWPMPRWR